MNSGVKFLRVVLGKASGPIINEYSFVEFGWQQELAELLSEGLLEKLPRTKASVEFRITEKGFAALREE